MSNIQPGDFNNLPIEKYEKEMFNDAYTTVTSLNLWDWLRNPTTPGEGGFMFSNSPEIRHITNTMKFGGHSGSSFGLTMRVMEAIAKKGWEYYVGEVILARTCPCRREKGLIGGWCGVAGGGVPACDH